jgi:hypothetical protein
MLLAVYEGLSYDLHRDHKPYKEFFLPDVLNGLRTDGKRWINILRNFLGNQYWLVNGASLYYCSLKKILLASGTDNYRKSYIEEIFTVIAKLLQLTGINCSSDWDFFLEYDWIFKENHVLAQTFLSLKHLPSNEESLTNLLIAAIDSGLEDIKSIKGRIRIFNKSKHPERLAILVLDSISDKVKKSLSYWTQLWPFLLNLAEKVKLTAVHERVLAVIENCSYRDTLSVGFSLLKLMSYVLADEKLRTSEVYRTFSQRILQILKPRITKLYDYHPNCYWSAATILAIEPDHKFTHVRNLGISAASSIKAHQNPLIMMMTDKRINTLVEDFKKITGSAAAKNESSSFQLNNSAMILIDFIHEFNEEEYFNDLRKYAIEIFLSNSTSILKYCAPIYVWAEILHCFKVNIEVPKILRSFLLDVNSWYFKSENLCYFLRVEILKEICKSVLVRGSLDSDLVGFVASLYFFQEEQPDIVSVLVLAQLAR